jgi:ADP-dependent NAD(P)H-hydrate dehydratase / NAD(P)H-hydrate epimerase
MKVLDNQQMRLLDRITASEYKIPGLIFMENAGMNTTIEVMKALKEDYRKKVIIISGTGNNGGDGFAIARHLYNKDVQVKVYIVGDESLIKNDAWVNLEAIKAMRVSIGFLKDENDMIDFNLDLMKSDIIVDALFGTGLNTPVKGIANEVIRVVNKVKRKIISVDIPSGISGDTGKVLGNAIRATKTVVYQLPKIGNLTAPGIEYNGELLICPIGIPQDAIHKSQYEAKLITEKTLKDIIPIRRLNSHKGDYGRALIIAGSRGMTGAAILASRAALRSGVGMLHLAIPETLNDILETQLTEVMTVPFQVPEDPTEDFTGVEEIIEGLNRSNVVALGPGLGRSRETEIIVERVLKEAKCPVILDADALNVLPKMLKLLKKVKSRCILTPHPGEMARITGLSISEINENRIKVAKDFSRKYGVIVVLKGASTVITDEEGQVFLNTTGNPGMATAGSGDVLTGIITALVGQKIDMIDAAMAGVYIHGRSGDEAAKITGEYGMIASDMVKEVPRIITEIVNKKKII